MMKKTLLYRSTMSIFAMLLVAMTTYAANYTEVGEVDGLKYYTSSDDVSGLYVGQGSKTTGDIVVPAQVKIDGEYYAVVGIKSYGFMTASGATGISSISLPASIKKIDAGGLCWTENLTAIYCQSTTPPTLGSMALYNAGSADEGLTLYVPSGNEDAYQEAWGSATTFTAVESLPEVSVAYNTVFEYDGVWYTVLNATDRTVAVTRVGGISYSDVDNDKGATYTGYDGDIEVAQHPAYEYLSFTTTNLGTYCFWVYKTGISTLTSVKLPETVSTIGGSAFRNCDKLTTVNVPAAVTTITNNTFYACAALEELPLHDGITSIGGSAFYGCKALKDFWLPAKVTSIQSSTFYGCTGFTSLVIPEGVTSIGSQAFDGCNKVTEITLPSTLKTLSDYAFRDSYLPSNYYTASLKKVTINATTPPTYNGYNNDYAVFAGSQGFNDSYYYARYKGVTLYVPEGYGDTYAAAPIWKYFNTHGDGIMEMKEADEATVTIGSAGYATFCSTHALDFTEVEGLKAYIASYYDPETGVLTVTKIDKAPAKTGLLLKGTAGDYAIPFADKAPYCVNLLVGTTVLTEVPATSGDYTNFLLANGSNGLGFYPTSGGSLAGGKAYLPLPTSLLSSDASSKGLTMTFDDATGISTIGQQGHQADNIWYTLGGQRLSGRPTQAGIYVRNGKKTIVTK